MRFVLPVLTLAACAHPQIAVHGDEVLHHLDELGRDGGARLATVRGDGSSEQPADPEMVFLYQTVSLADASAPLSHFVDGCGPFAGVRPCRMRVADRIVLRDVDSGTHDPGPRPSAPPVGESAKTADKASAATFFFGGLAGMGLCIALCEEHKVGYSVALASGGLVAAVVWAILDGAHD